MEDYLYVAKNPIVYEILKDPLYARFNGSEVKIHKKHKDILDAYLLDDNVTIYVHDVDGFYSVVQLAKDEFINNYMEELNYSIASSGFHYERLRKLWNKSHPKKETFKEQLVKEVIGNGVETIKAPNSDIVFLKPEFECELIKIFEDKILAVTTDDEGIFGQARWYGLDGTIGGVYSKFSLTPYPEPKEWYEIEENFPCLIKVDDVISVAYEYQKENGCIWDGYADNISSANDVERLSNEEIDTLKVKAD